MGRKRKKNTFRKMNPEPVSPAESVSRKLSVSTGSFSEKPTASSASPYYGKRYQGSNKASVYLEDLAAIVSGSADTEVSYELEDLRAVSGALVKSNPIANSIISKKVLSVVGAGLVHKANVDWEYLGLTEEQGHELNRKIDRELRLYCEKKGACDLERDSTMAELCSVIQHTKLERGDVFANFVYRRRAGERYGLKCQIIEADQVSNPGYANDTAECSGGIQRYGNGEIYGFWFNRYGYPDRGAYLANNGKGDDWKFINFYNKYGRRIATHLKTKTRPGQSRGIPDLSPVVETLAQGGRFKKEYLQKAVVSALLTLLYKGDNLSLASNPLLGIGSDRGDSDGKGVKLGSGTSAAIGNTEDIALIESKTPGPSFEPFITAISQEIAAGCNLPVELVLGKFTSSYTAAQAALLEAWRYFLTERQRLIADFLDVMKELLIVEAVFNGYLQLDNFFTDKLAAEAYLRGSWVGMPKGHLQPAQAAKADQIAEQEGWKTPEQNAAERGNDYTGKKKLAADIVRSEENSMMLKMQENREVSANG